MRFITWQWIFHMPWSVFMTIHLNTLTHWQLYTSQYSVFMILSCLPNFRSYTLGVLHTNILEWRISTKTVLTIAQYDPFQSHLFVVHQLHQVVYFEMQQDTITSKHNLAFDVKLNVQLHDMDGLPHQFLAYSVSLNIRGIVHTLHSIGPISSKEILLMANFCR